MEFSKFVPQKFSLPLLVSGFVQIIYSHISIIDYQNSYTKLEIVTMYDYVISFMKLTNCFQIGFQT